MPIITTNASSFVDATNPPNNGYINSSVAAGTNNTVSVSILNNTDVLPSSPSSPSIGMGYSSQLFYNSLDTTNILPITGSYSPGANIQTVTASQLNSMSGTPNASNFYFNKTLLFLYYSNQTYGDNSFHVYPLPNAFITPAPPGGSLNSYGGVQIANATFTVQPCNQPTSLTATNYGGLRVKLMWIAPDNGGSPITDYLVQYRTSSGPGPWVSFTHIPSSASSIIITGLTGNVTYDFRVAGINGYCGGVGPTSGPFSNIATVLVYTIPTQPTNLVAIALDGGSVSLSWNASTSNAPPPITYTIQYKVGGFGDWMELDKTELTSYYIDNFDTIGVVNNSITYCFQVYAENIINDAGYVSNIAQAMPFDNSLVPSREWSRFEPNCPSFKTPMNNIANTSYDMQKKANVLQCPVNGILNFTKAMRWSMAARNQLTRKKAWGSQTQTNTYPNTTNIDNTPGVGLEEVNNVLTCWNIPSRIVCNPSSSSGVPGKPVILCYALDAPFNNYRYPQTYSAGGTKWPVFSTK